MKPTTRDPFCFISWSSSKKMSMSTFLCYIIGLLSSPLLMRADATTRTCTQIVGTYRDCLCGVMYRDVETHCQDNHTYYRPILTQQNLSCPFQCRNGGQLYQNSCICSLPQAQPSHGLCCEVPTPYCGEFLWEPTGEIQSPGFKLNIPYLPNSDCVWKISTDVNRTIALGLVDNTFDIEEGTNIYSCNRDYLAVYDGEDDQARRLGNFCGDANGMRAFNTLYSSGRHLYLKFKSDGENQKKGFHLRYQTFLKGSKCGRTTFSLQTGLITSPQYPINYRPGESCEYEIQVKPGHDLQLTTNDLNVPSQNPQCTDWREDRIQVLMKKTGTKIYTEVTSFCGKDLYPMLTIKGASSVLLKFTSNSVREGRFLLQYSQVPVSLQS